MATRTRTLRALAVLGALAFVAAACGDDDDEPAAPASTAAPAQTTAAPAETTAAPSDTTAAPAETTAAPTTEAPAKEPEPAPGFDGSTISVGILSPLTGAAALIGKPLEAGQQAYWQGLNAEEGGIMGKYKVNVITEDNEYKPDTTVQKYNKIKNDVAIISQVVGSQNNQTLLPLLEADKIIASPAAQDDVFVREQFMFPVIEPYQIDVINAFDYLWNEDGRAKDKVVCAVIQDDAYGEAGLQGLEFIGEKLGFEVKTTTRYKPTDTDFTAPVTGLQQAGCQVVLATALPTQFAGILGKSAQLGFVPLWVAQSPAYIDVLLGNEDLKKYMEANVLVAAVGPELSYEGNETAQLMAERQQKYTDQKTANYYFTFGYIQALAIHQLLEAAINNGDLSREGILKAMNEDFEGIDPQGLGGFYKYGPPEERVPPTFSTVFKVNSTAPFGLEALKVNFETPFAKEYVFD